MKPRDDDDDDLCPGCGNREPVVVIEHAGGSCPGHLQEWCGVDHYHYACGVCGRDWVTTHDDSDGDPSTWLWTDNAPPSFVAAALGEARAEMRARSPA